MLTPRQTQIMEQLISGMRHREVASNLGITRSAISTHMERICNRIEANTSIEAAVKFDRLRR
jgi:DNA-binding NarL/FixJ family response regulator